MFICMNIGMSADFMFQLRLTTGKLATNGYDLAKRLEDGLTTTSFIKALRRASMLNSDLLCFMVDVLHQHCF